MSFARYRFGPFLLGERAGVSRRNLLVSGILAVLAFGAMSSPGRHLAALVGPTGVDVRLVGALVLVLSAAILSTYNAYANRGLLVSFVVVFLPTFGFFFAWTDLGHAVGHSTPSGTSLLAEFVLSVSLATASSAMLTPLCYSLGLALRYLSLPAETRA